jgi:D-alanyl-D-alanine carboxypeptidase
VSDLEPGSWAPDPDAAPLTRRAARESAASANRLTPNFRRRRIIVGSIASAVAIGIVTVIVVFSMLGQGGKVDDAASPSPSTSRTPSSTPTPSPTTTPTPTPEVPIADIDTASSLTVVVNKHRPLNPVDYYPDVVPVPVPYVNQPFLRQEAADAVVQMFAAITAETGLELQAQSAFRSYDTQVSVYQGWVDSLGQDAADLTSARPGYSEHQTGLAIDVNALPDQGCALEPCWAGTPHAQWVVANAWRFGFIVRYQDGQTPITGYEYEPYHLRYVGLDIAKDMHDRGILSLEEYFGLDPAPDYPSDSV